MHNQVPPDPTQPPAEPSPYAAPPPYGGHPSYAASDMPYGGPAPYAGAAPYGSPPYGSPGPYGSPAPFGAPSPFGGPAQLGTFQGPQPMVASGPNGLAIGALVASICGGLGLGTILGFVLGISALVQIRRRPQKGFGLAVAALVISSITLVISIIGITGYIFDEMRNRAAGIEAVETTELKPGDCISSLDESSAVYDMPVVPCDKPHKAEVYHVFRFPAGAYPGEKAVEEESDERCGTAYEPYDTPENEDLEIYYLYPENAAGWNDDRSVLCIVAAPVTPRTKSIMK